MTAPPTAEGAGSGATSLAGDDEVNVLSLLATVVAKWRTVVVLPVACAVGAVSLSFLFGPMYSATTSFAPETPPQTSLPGGLAGLASQFGISLGPDASQSPDFYADLAQSREILTHLLLARYADPTQAQPTDSVRLLAILRAGGRNANDSLERGVRALGKLLSVDVSSATSVVTVTVKAHYAGLAAAVANRLVQYLNAFNTQTRQSQARERRKFIEQRVVQSGQDLHQAEDALRRFYEANRSWDQSPQLTFEEGRLRRQVDLRQELYLTLRREYESARIAEVNDTPVITVIDSAVVPQRRSSPRRSIWALVAFVFTGVTALLWTFVMSYMERARLAQNEPYSRLQVALHNARAELRTAARFLQPFVKKGSR